MKLLGVVAVTILLVVLAALALRDPGPPNVILIVADDLGYGELGSFGQRKIHTPNLDQMAAEGVRFTQFYAGAAVCAPSRSVLMTGQHVGHTRVRGNAWPEDDGRQELLPEDVTLAEVFKEAGYTTALVGKWGLGMPGSGGHPNQQGFDHFFGYLSQHHAHNYFPEFLWRDGEKVLLPNVVEPAGEGGIHGAGIATEARVYAPDLFVEEALEFISSSAGGESPFFLYFATNVPHSNNEAARVTRANGAEVPDLGRYGEEPWALGAQRHAAMVTRMDADVGRILERVRSLGIDDDTLVIFTSDNGPHQNHVEPGNFFRPRGPLRGFKGSLWEGGVRVPTLARWPGRISGGRVSAHVGHFADFMASFADLVGARAPASTDGISFLPALTGARGSQREHEWLYWELSRRDVGQAALLDGRWKGIRRSREDLALYDLEADVRERDDVSAEHPEIGERIREYLGGARSENPNWPAPQ